MYSGIKLLTLLFFVCWFCSFLLQMDFFRQQWKMKYKQLWLIWSVRLQNLVISFADLDIWSDQGQETMGFREAKYDNYMTLTESQDVGTLIYSGHFRSRLPVCRYKVQAMSTSLTEQWSRKLPCKAARAFPIDTAIPGRLEGGLLCSFHSLKAAWTRNIKNMWHFHSFVHSFNPYGKPTV